MDPDGYLLSDRVQALGTNEELNRALVCVGGARTFLMEWRK